MSVGEALTLASVLVLVITGIFIFLQVRELRRNISVLADQNLAENNQEVSKLLIEHPELEIAILLPELAGQGKERRIQEISTALFLLDFMDNIIGLRNAGMVRDDWWEDWVRFLVIWLSSPFWGDLLKGPLGQQYSNTVGSFYNRYRTTIEHEGKRKEILEFYTS